MKAFISLEKDKVGLFLRIDMPNFKNLAYLDVAKLQAPI